MTDETDKPVKTGAEIAAERRAARLKAELRANLARRKAQSRARRDGDEDDRPGSLLTGDGTAD